MRTPGSKGAPTAQDFKDASEAFQVEHKEKLKRKALELENVKATDARQEKEKKNMEIRHARQDAAAKVREIRKKVDEAFEINELYWKVSQDIWG